MTQTSMPRRMLMLGGAAFIASGCSTRASASATDRFATSPWRVKTDAQWRAELPADSYQVLRRSQTERPFSSLLDRERRAGTYVCRGCELPLFLSSWKYDSGTGWPSFYRANLDHIGTKLDFALVIPRVEYHCARCRGHQGHVFEDGPRPTGKRYCNNGVALLFKPG